MKKHVAVIGATGAVGSMVASQLLQSDALGVDDALTLVGRRNEKSLARLAALREDLLDAFSEKGVTIACSDRADVADVTAYVMCAGTTMSDEAPQRSDVAQANAPLFAETARLIAQHNPDALLIVVSNPVELAVAFFAKYLDRRQVIGIGAQQDSLRFARAVADHLGVTRADVEATVLGQHGEAMVPLWSAVRLSDRCAHLQDRLDALKARYADPARHTPAADLLDEAQAVADTSGLATAYDALDAGSPVTRILVEPILTVLKEHSTPNSTASATLQVLCSALASDDRPLHGQVLLQGEFADLRGVCGVPISVGASGWQIKSGVEPDAAEQRQLTQAAAKIAAEAKPLLDAVR